MHDSEFSLNDGLIYLNHAAVSPDWIAVESALREQLRRLINAASASEIALLKNTSEALSVVAYGLPWQHGDNVVITNQEFPSNRVVWESLEQYGVTTRAADITQAESPEAAIIACMDDDTRLLSVSSVQYGTGLRLDLVVLGSACRERNILFCVDAIQSLGALQFDVQACHADFVMADGHKWMLGPEGIALFYCRHSSMQQLALRQYGWHMLEDYLNFDRHSWEVADSARRFECGSPNMTGIHALHASLELIHEIGMQTIETQVLENTRFMLDFFSQRPHSYRLLTPQDNTRHAGIVTFRPLHESAESVHLMLTGENVACALRGGGVRFSPHFYTPRKQLFSALQLLDG